LHWRWIPYLSCDLLLRSVKHKHWWLVLDAN
jgi:hypothetical protein